MLHVQLRASPVQPDPQIPEPLWLYCHVAKCLNCSVRTCRTWVKKGLIPPEAVLRLASNVVRFQPHLIRAIAAGRAS